MMYDEPNLIQQGWQCPVCKRVYSPTTSMCWYCGGDQKVNVSTSTEGIITNDILSDHTNATSSHEMRFCILKGKLCTNASINGFCMLSACIN